MEYALISVELQETGDFDGELSNDCGKSLKSNIIKMQ